LEVEFRSGTQLARPRNDRSPDGVAIEEGDDAAIGWLLAPDIVFHSPVLHAPFLGREVVMALLSILRRRVGMALAEALGPRVQKLPDGTYGVMDSERA
jgi:hypothetical protein